MEFNAEITAALSAVTVAFVTGLFAWLLHRKNPQSILNESFRIIVEQLQQERLFLQQANNQFIIEIAKLRDQIKQLEEKVAYLEKILSQRSSS